MLYQLLDLHSLYKKQIKNGKYVRYYENGIINALGNFKEGQMNGDWSMFYENGKLLGTVSFKDGKVKK